MILILIILMILLLCFYSFSYKKENKKETFLVEYVKDRLNIEPALYAPVRTREYNRNHIPIELKKKILELIREKSNFKNVPIDIDYLKISNDSRKALWYVEIFIQDTNNFTTNKVVIQFWNINGVFKLHDARPFSFKDDKIALVQPIHGIQTGKILTNNSITNPLINNLQTGISIEDKTSLDSSNVHPEISCSINGRQGRQPYGFIYNQTIIPNNIYDKNGYTTFTPDMLNPNLYDLGSIKDLFSVSKGIPSFPTGHGTN
jgi:hypothetical protein